MEGVSVRMTRFKCWWCQRALGVKRLHHEVQVPEQKIRRCCTACNGVEQSNYRLIYPRGEVQERAEISRQYGCAL